jgi:uncharacterized protein YjbI with pentapeptide repeats
MVRTFPAMCVFRGAIFSKEANFYSAVFEHRTDFEGARFEDEASFTRCKFGAKAYFHSAVFKGDTQFSTDFTHEVSFVMAPFAKEAGFYNASFAKEAIFNSVKFEGEAVFARATFHQEADFGNADFLQEAFFTSATFKHKADFSARFTLDAHFVSTTFLKEVNFGEAIFRAAVEFRETRFREDTELLPGPIFTLTQFIKPESTFFYKTYLGQALFQNCDVSHLTFSSVLWRTRPNGKRQLFEECIELTTALELGSYVGEADERDYGLIAETYQQLKKNYNNRQDYWTAGDFHYGEMEMKRLHSPRRNKAVRWLHRNLGLVAWYRYASEYGESYARPLLALLVVLSFLLCSSPSLAWSSTNPMAPILRLHSHCSITVTSPPTSPLKDRHGSPPWHSSATAS